MAATGQGFVRDRHGRLISERVLGSSITSFEEAGLECINDDPEHLLSDVYSDLDTESLTYSSEGVYY